MGAKMQSELEPFLFAAALFMLGSTVPAALITGFLGGKWVWRLWLLIMLGIALYLLWFFTLSNQCCPTGMEGLALILWPLLGLGIGLGAFFGYAAVTVIKSLMGDR